MSLFKVYAALMVCLAATVALSSFHLGEAGPMLAIAIAALKAILIGAFFMKLKEASGGLRLFAMGSLFWVGVLVSLVWADYLMRGSFGAPGH
jgi:cytochrome c oxidase subunit IV